MGLNNAFLIKERRFLNKGIVIVLIKTSKDPTYLDKTF